MSSQYRASAQQHSLQQTSFLWQYFSCFKTTCEPAELRVPLPALPPATGVCFPHGITQQNLFPPWPLQSAPAQKLTEMINQPSPSSNLRKCLSWSLTKPKGSAQPLSGTIHLLKHVLERFPEWRLREAKGSLASVTLEIHQVSWLRLGAW